MYFLWKQTPHGIIRVSHEGLSDFVLRLIPRSGPRLQSLALAGSEADGAQVTLVLFPSLREDREGEGKLERRLSLIMGPMGMRPSVIWAGRGGPGSEWADLRRALLGNPWAWMALASSVALVVTAGWAGFFWTAFWGMAAWFTVRGLAFLKTWIGDNLG